MDLQTAQLTTLALAFLYLTVAICALRHNRSLKRLQRETWFDIWSGVSYLIWMPTSIALIVFGYHAGLTASLIALSVGLTLNTVYLASVLIISMRSS